MFCLDVHYRLRVFQEETVPLWSLKRGQCLHTGWEHGGQQLNSSVCELHTGYTFEDITYQDLQDITFVRNCQQLGNAWWSATIAQPSKKSVGDHCSPVSIYIKNPPCSMIKSMEKVMQLSFKKTLLSFHCLSVLCHNRKQSFWSIQPFSSFSRRHGEILKTIFLSTFFLETL